ncbi:MAG: radical SAM protein [Myxococcales bacterium]|nr:radical SAM protein [Myxococcales bacterium]MCB9521042.1 radical SAM protein [Myxococcales bacterium]MCB9532452.1 radical SAM protein [Myxococcales bacterium]
MALRAESNPPNPWRSAHSEWIDAPPPPVQPRVYLEEAREILSENRSPDLGFRFSLNPYRGCQHACAYCYARPTHQYWDLGAGTDFDSKIIVKTNAADALRRTFGKRTWSGERIVFSGNTDCYQPLEASYGLTRSCLEVCLEHRNPVGIITKSALVRRDIDVIAALAEVADAHVFVSLAFSNAEHARAIEPGAPTPAVRFKTIESLVAAGISVGVAVAPIIPGLNDDQAPEVLRLARDAGATSAFRSLVRLAPPVDAVFEERVRERLPLRCDRILAGIRDARSGELTTAGFGARFVGAGARWAATAALFDSTCARLGLATGDEATLGVGAPARATFRRPTAQLELL